MPQVLIDNLDDPRIAKYRNLKRTNQTRDDDQFVVEGEKLLERLVESTFPLASVLATERHAPRVEAIIPADVPFYVVSFDLISVIVGFNFHRGVLACGLRRPWPDLAEIVGPSNRSTIVVCPELNNPENLGTIVRIGDVFGVDAVLVGGSCPDPLSRRVLRVSMGTSLHLPVIVREDLDSELNRLRSDWGFELMATVVDPLAESFDSIQRPERLALFMGSESEGLDPHWIRQCQRQITIPMRPDAESLNVAVAAGIFLYHFSRINGAS
ncbi:tRNA G18 (ribose-2'-O)-methylase SpoU [Singulisphaera sp. GP187]|uniref:TrmH family RNA methyltransferase n=1 Tax=Singulisphaera sp. GP187 TaxID=1882752 RepID=UPI000927CC44|nr:RNA methyltransferase [Singulisphaera sp. GP187]SIN91027.1 tRNA G18 (ribose-2'-O)-methylase SpoU [Singulisphaera sp. GP187]